MQRTSSLRFAFAFAVSSIIIASLDAFVIHHPYQGNGVHRTASKTAFSSESARQSQRVGAGGLRAGAGGGVINLACSIDSGRKKVLVVGGTGRVGGSTARWLLEFGEEEGVPVDVVLGGRSEKNYRSSLGRIGAKLAGKFDLASRVSFAEVDIEDKDQLFAAVDGMDLVVHTAGPFQGLDTPLVLDAALQKGVPYVDVCDEKVLCEAAKERMDAAEKAGVAAIVSAGIWPGSSALLAAACVDALRDQGQECDELDMCFFTAGTGNAGATIVAATFLLLVEPVLTYLQGVAVEEEAWSGAKDADFGGGVGSRRVWLLDNPDVYTIHDALGVPNIASRFATAPMAWNYLFGALRLIPASILGDKTFGRGLAVFSDPIIRVVDALVGATNAMRIDAYGGGRRITARVTHDDLENCVGIGTAAFAMELLNQRVKPGVHFPPALWEGSGKQILERVRRDSCQWEVPGMP